MKSRSTSGAAAAVARPRHERATRTNRRLFSRQPSAAQERLLCALLCYAAGCASPIADPSSTTVARGEAALILGLPDAARDVAMFEVTLHSPESSCFDEPLVRVDAVLEQPDEQVSRPQRSGVFSSALVLLETGVYLACAHPLTAAGLPSAECDVAEANLAIFAGETTSLGLVSQCDGVSSGLASITASLNSPPVLLDLSATPSHFVHSCEGLDFLAVVADPDGDEVDMHWYVDSHPAGALFGLELNETTASFVASTPGDYLLGLELSDSLGAVTHQTVPAHVTMGENTTCCQEGRCTAEPPPEPPCGSMQTAFEWEMSADGGLTWRPVSLPNTNFGCTYCTRHYRTHFVGTPCGVDFRFASDNEARMMVNGTVVFDDYYVEGVDWCTTASCCSLCCDTTANCDYAIAGQTPFGLPQEALDAFGPGTNEIRWQVNQQSGGSGFHSLMTITH